MQLPPPALQQAIEAPLAAFFIDVRCHRIDGIPFPVHLSFVFGDCLDVALVRWRIFPNLDLFLPIGELRWICFHFFFFVRLRDHVTKIEVGRAILHSRPPTSPQQLGRPFSRSFDFIRLPFPLLANAFPLPRRLSASRIPSVLDVALPSSTWRRDSVHPPRLGRRPPSPSGLFPSVPNPARVRSELHFQSNGEASHQPVLFHPHGCRSEPTHCATRRRWTRVAAAPREAKTAHSRSKGCRTRSGTSCRSWRRERIEFHGASDVRAAGWMVVVRGSAHRRAVLLLHADGKDAVGMATRGSFYDARWHASSNPGHVSQACASRSTSQHERVGSGRRDARAPFRVAWRTTQACDGQEVDGKVDERSHGSVLVLGRTSRGLEPWIERCESVALYQGGTCPLFIVVVAWKISSRAFGRRSSRGRLDRVYSCPCLPPQMENQLHLLRR